jgi:hypothetical protein
MPGVLVRTADNGSSGSAEQSSSIHVLVQWSACQPGSVVRPWVGSDDADGKGRTSFALVLFPKDEVKRLQEGRLPASRGFGRIAFHADHALQVHSFGRQVVGATACRNSTGNTECDMPEMSRAVTQFDPGTEVGERTFCTARLSFLRVVPRPCAQRVDSGLGPCSVPERVSHTESSIKSKAL